MVVITRTLSSENLNRLKLFLITRVNLLAQKQDTIHEFLDAIMLFLIVKIIVIW